MLDAVSNAETPTAAPAPHTRAPVLIPRAVANACLRTWVIAARSTNAVSRQGITVTSPATTAKEEDRGGQRHGMLLNAPEPNRIVLALRMCLSLIHISEPT